VGTASTLQIFQLEMLPAGDGDCLLLSWGEGDRLHHIVVDGGRASAYPILRDRLKGLADRGDSLELYVLTHIDADHIEGALAYLKDEERPIVPKQVWYNGRPKMTTAGARSMAQGDAYSTALAELGWPLNTAFENGIAKIEASGTSIDVAGLKITMLSPDEAHLAALGKRWHQWHQQQAFRARGIAAKKKKSLPPDPLIVEDLIAPGPTDSELPNGSSIAFVAEWAGCRILLAGDAHPDLLARTLAPLAAGDGGRYRIDLFKASHHGSAKNTNRDLIELLDCSRLAISTNGSIHGHPDPQSLAIFLHFSPPGTKDIYFNYATSWTRPWANAEIERRYDFRAHLPTEEHQGCMLIDLMSPAAPNS
jgi:beta-lactamase superfamily II metal-dependent hydrolase